ncbi:MAG: hypothetical protein ACI80P_001540 [Flavobacteriales bacterium]
MKGKISLIVSFLFLIACNKNDVEGMQIEGEIRDSRHGAGVSAASVLVQEQVVEGGALNGALQFAVQTTSDGGGEYTANFERKNALTYNIDFTKAGYFDVTREVNPDNLSPGVGYTVNTVMTPEAFIEVNIFNANPETSEDFMRFRYMNANFDCECCGNSWMEFTGTIVDSTLTCRLHGDYTLYYTFEVNRGEEIIEFDSIFCPAFQTTVLNIGY